MLLPNGIYASPTEYHCRASLSPIGEPITVHVGAGPKQGICGFWNNERRGGDILDLVEVVNGLSRPDAIEWAKRHLGINDNQRTRPQPQPDRKIETRRDDDGPKRTARAAGIWESSKSIRGAAVAYLNARGIDASLDSDGQLRSHHGLPHPNGGSFPAIVARVSDARGKGCGIWRIFLKPDGSGKAPVENPKLGLGQVSGGSVRLGGIWPEIGIAEGIETALACRMLLRGRNASKTPSPVWAALSTSGMRGVEIPGGVQHIRIFADHDAPFIRNGVLKPSPGLAAAEALQERAEAGGIKVTIERPPFGKDWLDVMLAQTKMENETR